MRAEKSASSTPWNCDACAVSRNACSSCGEHRTGASPAAHAPPRKRGWCKSRPSRTRGETPGESAQCKLGWMRAAGARRAAARSRARVRNRRLPAQVLRAQRGLRSRASRSSQPHRRGGVCGGVEQVVDDAAAVEHAHQLVARCLVLVDLLQLVLRQQPGLLVPASVAQRKLNKRECNAHRWCAGISRCSGLMNCSASSRKLSTCVGDTRRERRGSERSTLGTRRCSAAHEAVLGSANAVPHPVALRVVRNGGEGACIQLGHQVLLQAFA